MIFLKIGRYCLNMLTIISLVLPTAVFSNDLLADEKNTIAVFNRISPKVAYVYRMQKVMNAHWDVFEVPTGTGSGFLWDDRGHIVTNFHVIAGATDLAVSLQQGKTVKAKVVGTDPSNDIAVLGITSLVPYAKSLLVADSDQLQVGQKTIAIGNPFGLSKSITTGIISALGRQVPGYTQGLSHHNMIQTDASINQGNSGGPLLDSQGRLIGMNTAIYSRTGGSIGIGFAVPSNEIKRSVAQLIAQGRIVQPGIGVTRIEDYIAKQLGVRGVIVDQVIKGSPAAKAGICGTQRNQYGQVILGDIIIALDDIKIKRFDDLYNGLRKRQVGDWVTIHVLRKGKKLSFKIRTVDIGQ